MGIRTQIQVRGTVQGVGFRPFIYSLAQKNELLGRVLNNEAGVLIEVEGESDLIERFIRDIKLGAPPLSVIESVESQPLGLPGLFTDFRIASTESAHDALVPVAADVSTCHDCLRELFDPEDRRYRYPFINCTNCGPRFTLIETVPYDRANTTMVDFRMCVDCRAEYEDPADRRFHAEPIACPACGPAVFLSPDGWQAGDPDIGRGGSGTGAIDQTRRLLNQGRILAIKGLGGYHLACNALDGGAVDRLRTRKFREDKAFALMAPDVETIKRYAHVSDLEADLLRSKERPIVLLKRLDGAELPSGVAPGLTTLGFMLPYTPLHYLLVEGFGGPLVMTSGNISDEPICYTDTDAGERLSEIADHYLTHDRRINMRVDDSVMRVTPTVPPRFAMVRRSRGYAPAPVRTGFRFTKQILACGAELKNTFCLTRDHHAYVSHHIGDLENMETLASYTAGIEHYRELFNLKPEVVAYDLHPEYLSTKYALACPETFTKIAVQHHHAHIASCLVDNGAEGEVIGVAMDGLGFGTDGKLWGGEFFVADLTHAERVGHLANVPLPGGARAIREPWRLAASYLHRSYGDGFLDLDLAFVKGLDRGKWRTLESMIAGGVNCPETSSMGRLFDAVSALIGVRGFINYEGQAAIELEAIADESERGHYEFQIAADGEISAEPVIRAAVDDLLDGRPSALVSARFHNAVADLIGRTAGQIRSATALRRVALSGGVFQNMFLLGRTCERLVEMGFDVLTHSRVPAGDGGISLGQAAIANAKIRQGSI